MKITLTFDVNLNRSPTSTPTAVVLCMGFPLAPIEVAAEIETIGDRAAFIELAMGAVRRRLAEILRTA
jgi:hypothetical protein